MSLENCLLICKVLNNFSLSLLNDWFSFASETNHYKRSFSTKGFLKIHTINTKSYGKYSVKINSLIVLNEIQKQTKNESLSTFSSHQAKSVLTKQLTNNY